MVSSTMESFTYIEVTLSVNDFRENLPLGFL